MAKEGKIFIHPCNMYRCPLPLRKKEIQITLPCRVTTNFSIWGPKCLKHRN
jgi:hypothetical protein